ncbi:MAG: hypothetical protein ACXW2E_00650 [Nitrososphaeraceae archaeon]
MIRKIDIENLAYSSGIDIRHIEKPADEEFNHNFRKFIINFLTQFSMQIQELDRRVQQNGVPPGYCVDSYLLGARDALGGDPSLVELLKRVVGEYES